MALSPLQRQSPKCIRDRKGGHSALTAVFLADALLEQERGLHLGAGHHTQVNKARCPLFPFLSPFSIPTPWRRTVEVGGPGTSNHRIDNV